MSVQLSPSARYSYEPQSLIDRRAVISGGTTGIGRATALRLTMAGAKVLVFGRHQQDLDEALNDLNANNGQAFGIAADQSKEEDVRRVFEEADRRLGGVDILVNNAAVSGDNTLNSDFEAWRYALETNILGYIACTRAALDRMLGKTGGHIVNVGSLSAKVNEPGSEIYSATKAAMRSYSESLRKTVNEKGIKITLIEPGAVDTDLGNDSSSREETEDSISEGKILQSEDIAEAIHYALVQPSRSDVIVMQVRPHKQLI